MDEQEPIHLPDDPSEEQLRLENDIMKLKLQAEFGAQFGEISNEVPPEMEQEFLKQVYDFEKAWEKQEMTTVGNLLGNPVFKPLADIAPERLVDAWQDVVDTYNHKNISLDFEYEYPLAEKYRFATEELPLHDTMFVNMPSMMLGFIYEEFHPNHSADMEKLVKKFLDGWFDQDAEACLDTLSDELITDDGRILPKAGLKDKLTSLFDSFKQLVETEFFISETSYNSQQEEALLMPGYVEGAGAPLWNTTKHYPLPGRLSFTWNTTVIPSLL